MRHGMKGGRWMIFVLWAGLFVSHCQSDDRTWISSDGTELEAALVRLTGDAVVLRRTKDSKEFSVPLSKLSPGDRRYVLDQDEDSSKESVSRKLSPDLLTGEWERLRLVGHPKKSAIQIFGPDSVPAGKTVPLIVYLRDRGSVEGGLPLSGAEHFVSKSSQETHPCIVVSLPLRLDGDETLIASDEFLKEAVEALPIDPERIYFVACYNGSRTVTNYLNGGGEQVAALILLSGLTINYKSTDAPQVRSHLAIRAVNGAIRPGSSKEPMRNSATAKYVEIAKTAGADAELMIKKDVAHDDLEWVALKDPALRGWLFKQIRRKDL